MRILTALAAAALFVGAPADLLANGRKAGSLLFYPVHHSGNGCLTIINVTNTNVTPGSGTNVHFEYANTIPTSMRFLPKDCIIFDRVENLTHADTLSVLTTCHNATTAGVSQGYLVITAEDPDKFYTPWSFNYLVGSAMVLSATGIAYSVNAVPFKSPVAARQVTDLNSNRQRDFDNREYEAIPDVLIMDSFLAMMQSSLSLTSLTGTPQDRHTVLFNVWNDNEFPLSATLTFKCWFDEPLTSVSQLFSSSFLRRLKNDPRELDVNCDGRGDFETGWAMIQSIGVRQPGGNLVARDGALLGSLTNGKASFGGGRLLWESDETQTNGHFFGR